MFAGQTGKILRKEEYSSMYKYVNPFLKRLIKCECKVS